MARPLWTGSLSFGLVAVPIKVVPATRSHDVRFNMLCVDEGVRVRRKLVCGDDDAEVSQKDTAKGYEVAPDEYAVVKQEELDALAPEKTREMNVEQFINLEEIDPIYFERSYYLLPDENGLKAYRLLQRVMQETGKVGIARFVMRNREYLVAIRPLEGVLSIATLRYHDEVIQPQEILDEMPRKKVQVDDRQLKLAEQLVDSLNEEWKPENFQDEYRQRVLELVEAKIKGEEVVTTEPREKKGKKSSRVIDLMAALEKSLGENQGGGSKRSGNKKKSAAKKSSAQKSTSKKKSAAKKSGGRKSA